MHPNSRKNLKPRWKPGESGNPAGKLCLTDILKKELQQVIDYIIPGLPPNKDNLTGAQLVVKALVLAGIKGKIDAIEKIFDRTDGKVALPLTGGQGEPLLPHNMQLFLADGTVIKPPRSGHEAIEVKIDGDGHKLGGD